MISLLRRLFIDNWQRKLFSFILAMLVWILVHHSMLHQKTLSNIPVRIINLPPGKTVEGLQDNAILNKKITLSLYGNKNTLEDLSPNDLEVVIDACGKKDSWVATIEKKTLVSLRPDIDIYQNISRVSYQNLIVKMSNLITEKIPIIVTNPTGEAPKGYQYLDIWPHELYLTVTGPEDMVKNLKIKKLAMTFSLQEIIKDELNLLTSEYSDGLKEVTYLVPDGWKKISIPSLSENPITIDDPAAAKLRIDFIKTQLISIPSSIPITVFYPLQYTDMINPKTYPLVTNAFVKNFHGIKQLSLPFFAKGVSSQFIEVIADRIQIVIIPSIGNEQSFSCWHVEFIHPKELEDRYVSKLLCNIKEENGLQTNQQEEFYRNRFRNYMNSFRLYNENGKKLSLNIELRANGIEIIPKKYEQ